MPNLPTMTQTQWRAFLSQQYARYATAPASDAVGEPLDAIFYALSLMATQIQGQVVLAAAASRLKTSGGFDIDTFVAPFGVVRLPGVAAQGQVIFTTPSPVTQPFTIPFGTVVQSTSGALYTVIADPTQAAYTASGYVIGAGQSSCTVTVLCTQAGILGNALPNTITVLAYGPGTGQPIAGISSVTNPYALANGQDPESDAALISRFQTVVAGGGVATAAAILGAVLAIQPGLTVSYGDNLLPNGAPSVPGSYSIIVNALGQATGPSNTLIAAANAAVDSVRSAGDTPYVSGPTLSTVTIGGSILLSSTADPVLTPQNANAAAAAFVNDLGLDMLGNPVTLSRARLAQAILAVSGVADVLALTLDGQAADLIAPFGVQLVALNSGLVVSLPTGVVV